MKRAVAFVALALAGPSAFATVFLQVTTDISYFPNFFNGPYLPTTAGMHPTALTISPTYNVPIDCKQFESRALQITALTDSLKRAAEEQAIATANNDTGRVAQLAAIQRDLLPQIEKRRASSAVLNLRPITAEFDILPDSQISRFILAHAHPVVDDSGDYDSYARFRSIRYRTLRSVIPVAARDPYAEAKFEVSDAPSDFSWAPFLDAKAPAQLRFGHEFFGGGTASGPGRCFAYDSQKKQCLRDNVRLFFDLTEQDFCGATLANSGSLLAFEVEYATPKFGGRPLRVTYRVGHQLRETSAETQSRRNAENIALDLILRDLLFTILGPQQSYRVSDAQLAPFRDPAKSGFVELREALAQAYDSIAASGPIPTNQELVAYFDKVAGRYVGRGSDIAAFVYAKNGRTLELGFQSIRPWPSRVNRAKLVYVKLDSTTLYESRDFRP